MKITPLNSTKKSMGYIIPPTDLHFIPGPTVFIHIRMYYAQLNLCLINGIHKPNKSEKNLKSK